MTTRNPFSPFRTPWRSYLTQQSHHAIYCYLPAYFFFIFIFLCLTPSPIPLPFLHPAFHSPTYASPIPSPVLLILMTYLLSFLPSTALFSYLSACDFNPPPPSSNPTTTPDADSILATKHATTSNVRIKDAFMQCHLYFALLDVFLANSHSLNIDSYSTDGGSGNFCNP